MGSMFQISGRPSGISDAGIVWGIGYYASDDIATLDVTPAVPPQSLAAVPATQMTFDTANRLATFNGQSVTHDADGNMVSGPLPATGAMGNYTYDSRNRLTNAGEFAYRYNAEGNRVGLTSANETTTLTVDPQGALPKVLERVKNGIRTRYVYGAGLQYEVNDAGSATYYHYDQSGNTAALTNQAGAIIERVVYSPYGTIRYRQSNFDTPFLYGGFFGVMTDANGLIAMRARYYNPLTMRFLNSDPAMDGLNWYAYANGNPINFADPTGYGAQKVLGDMNKGSNWSGVGGQGNPLLAYLGITASPVSPQQKFVDSFLSGNVMGMATSGLQGFVQSALVSAVTLAVPGSVARVAPVVTAAKVEAAVVNTEVTVYRAFGGDARAQGFSWTTKDPRTYGNFRDVAGLPSGGASGATNTADFLITGKVNAADIISSRSALPLDGNRGGLPELIIDPKNVRINDFSVLKP